MGAVEVLIVEDNEGDVRLVKEAMARVGLSHHVTVLTDGVQAMEFLRRCGQYRTACRPDLIVLDLKLPRKDGREVLAEITPDPELARIPMAVLSSSQSELERAKAYNLPQECYFTKPATFTGYMQVVKSIEEYRLKTASRL